jgi:membrane protease YdiL (CAAX protease family)
MNISLVWEIFKINTVNAMNTMNIATDTQSRLPPNWRHVGAFLGLTFGLTWLLDLAIYLRGGLRIQGIVATLQLQMLLPALSAIVLGLFFFPESPIFRKRSAGSGRWFYYYFLLVALIYALGTLILWLSPAQNIIVILSAIPQVLAFLGLLVLVVLRLAAGREAMARVWLAWGSWRYYLLFGLSFVAYYILQTVLNAVFGLGSAQLAPIPAPGGLNSTTFLVLGVVQSVLIAPFLAIVIAFGEEYGWRGYLQTELFKIGRVRGVLLLGVIWGAWHWPLILMGYNYPGHPLFGLLLMVLYTMGLAVVLGYAVLKSGSVLLSSYLHALNNQVIAFIVALGFRPNDNAFSFDIGIYGIVTLAIIALLIMLDPVWRGKGSSLP